jgi:hypothetical protein
MTRWFTCGAVAAVLVALIATPPPAGKGEKQQEGKRGGSCVGQAGSQQKKPANNGNCDQTRKRDGSCQQAGEGYDQAGQACPNPDCPRAGECPKNGDCPQNGNCARKGQCRGRAGK